MFEDTTATDAMLSAIAQVIPVFLLAAFVESALLRKAVRRSSKNIRKAKRERAEGGTSLKPWLVKALNKIDWLLGKWIVVMAVFFWLYIGLSAFVELLVLSELGRDPAERTFNGSTAIAYVSITLFLILVPRASLLIADSLAAAASRKSD